MREVRISESARCKEQDKVIAAQKQENERLCREVSILQGRFEKSIERNRALRATMEGIHLETQKKILGIEAESRKTIEALKKQILALQEENNALRKTATDDAAADVDKNEAEIQQTKIQLPDERILFLGGHENMLKKLRQKHPGWTYIGDDSSTKITWDMTFDVCFIWYKHLSHKAFLTVQNRVDNRAPIIYLNSTNLECLEQEMMVGYQKFQAEQTVELDGDNE